MTIQTTTTEGLARAWLAYEGDWDAQSTVSAEVPRALAERMLRARGWKSVLGRGGRHCGWRAPNGDTFWETDEALQLALVAEVLDTPDRLG